MHESAFARAAIGGNISSFAFAWAYETGAGEYAPAYQYGSTVGGDARYSGRDWSAIEPDIRRDWETSHRGSAWENFKDAVRHGWESVTGRR